MPLKLTSIFFVAISNYLTCFSLQAQDAPMSQFFSNMVVLNPAFSGTINGERLNLFYRNQWIQTNAGFQSFGASYDRSFSEYNSGLGVILTNEINGAFISPTIDVAYSYMIKIKKQVYLSMAMQGGLAQKYLRASDLIFENQMEAITAGFSKVIPDFSVGAVIFYSKYYGGVSIDHIAEPFQGTNKSRNERLNRKYTGFIGYMYYFNGRLLKQERVLSPNILVQIQGKQQNINWGSSFQYDNLIGGMWIRHNLKLNFDALILSAGYKTKNYKFAYSYDINIGKKTLVPLGAHEISFTMLFDSGIKKKPKSINCPTFLE